MDWVRSEEITEDCVPVRTVNFYPLCNSFGAFLLSEFWCQTRNCRVNRRENHETMGFMPTGVSMLVYKKAPSLFLFFFQCQDLHCKVSSFLLEHRIKKNLNCMYKNTYTLIYKCISSVLQAERYH